MVEWNRRSRSAGLPTRLARITLKNVQITILVTALDTRRRVVCHLGACIIEWFIYLLTLCTLQSKVHRQVGSELGNRFYPRNLRPLLDCPGDCNSAPCASNNFFWTHQKQIQADVPS